MSELERQRLGHYLKKGVGRTFNAVYIDEIVQHPKAIPPELMEKLRRKLERDIAEGKAFVIPPLKVRILERPMRVLFFRAWRHFRHMRRHLGRLGCQPNALANVAAEEICWGRPEHERYAIRRALMIAGGER